MLYEDPRRDAHEPYQRLSHDVFSLSMSGLSK
jgi:hypothetical protein